MTHLSMTRRRMAGALALLCVGSPARATMQASMRIEELFAEAYAVGVVKVLEAREVSAGGQPCGARYRGRVEGVIKNTTDGALFEFGYVPFLKVGASYLLFLRRYADVPVETAPAFAARCESVLPSAAIVGQWRGAMEVAGDTSSPGQRDRWLIRPPRLVVFPPATRSTLVNGQKHLYLGDLLKRMPGP